MDELDLLSRLRPEAGDPDPTMLARHRIALLNHAADPKPVRAPRRWSLPRLTMTAPVLAGVVAVGLVAWLSGTPGPATPPDSAASVLNLAAEKADATSAGHGDYAYTNTMTVYHDGGTRVVRTETWTKVDGTDGLTRTDRGNGQVEERPLGKPITVPGGRLVEASSSGPTYAYLATLPTDPEKLRDELYAKVQRDHGQTAGITLDQWVFQEITALVKNAMPPALKSALYRVAATIPGDESVPDATDAAGRHGIGVSHPLNDAGDKGILIFDSNTYQLLGAGGYVSDGRTEADALLASGLVDRIGQTP